jgi:hypothetical protein
MILERVDVISSALIAELVANKTPESSTLEFKRDLPGTSDGDKREFLKDVCAMANSRGGDILYGVQEKDGAAAALAPITSESADAAMRRLGQLLDACLEPRVRGLRFKPVELASGGYALLARVPQSQVGPHRYVHQGQSRFPLRNETHISDMSYEQLRNAFDRTATLSERAKEFRSRRVEAISKGGGGKAVAGGTSALVHVMPLSSMGGQEEVDVVAAHARFTELALSGWNSIDRLLNLDGLLVYQALGKDELYNYVQLYRSGMVEIYSSPYSFERGDQSFIPSQNLAHFFHEAIGKALATPARFGVGGGAFIGISLLDAAGHTLGVGQMFNLYHKAVSDRPDLVLPERWVESIDEFKIDDVAKPLLDMLWQCFGLERCSYYDDAGVWVPNRRFN